jgi:hypothetical protein
MAWTLAGNLDCRSDHVRNQYPGITIYAIGDQSHQTEASDHNPDSRGVVHAIDVMTYSNIARGNEIVEWCLADTTDLEYVIFNYKIWTRSGGWRRESYYGSNPHTDHPHLSGKHGSTGWSPGTGTGYDTAAEAYRPAGMGDDVSASEVWNWDVDPSESGRYSASGSLWTTLNRTDYLANNFGPATTQTLSSMSADIADIETGLKQTRAKMLSMENHIQDMRVDVAATSRGSAETRILLILILVILVAGVAAFAAWSATS